MPVHDGSGSNQDERLPPSRPEHSQRNPEQLVQGSQSSARPLRVQSEQLPTESQVFEDDVLARAKRADDPPEEMPERHNHGKNIIGTIRLQLFCQGIHFAGVRRFGEAQASAGREPGVAPGCEKYRRSPQVASLQSCETFYLLRTLVKDRDVSEGGGNLSG